MGPVRLVVGPVKYVSQCPASSHETPSSFWVVVSALYCGSFLSVTSAADSVRSTSGQALAAK